MAVPPLRLVGEKEYGELPTFIRSQMPLDVLNATLQQLHAVATERSSGGCCGMQCAWSGLQVDLVRSII